MEKNMRMKAICIKIPEERYKQIKLSAVEKGLSLTDYIQMKCLDLSFKVVEEKVVVKKRIELYKEEFPFSLPVCYRCDREVEELSKDGLCCQCEEEIENGEDTEE